MGIAHQGKEQVDRFGDLCEQGEGRKGGRRGRDFLFCEGAVVNFPKAGSALSARPRRVRSRVGDSVKRTPKKPKAAPVAKMKSTNKIKIRIKVDVEEAEIFPQASRERCSQHRLYL